MTDQQKQQIQADAERAAQERQTPNVACNHPFSSEQGRYWVACYQAEWDRRYGLRPTLEDGEAGMNHEERRGKYQEINNGNEPGTGAIREGATQAERSDTSAIGGAMRNGEDEHNEYRAGQSNPDRTHDQRDSASNGLSGESEVREAVAAPNRLAREAMMVARGWPEDKLHENGEYQCLCCYCKEFFIGHKRRVVCKLCAEARS